MTNNQHNHDNAAPCPHCVAVNQTGDKVFGEKLRAFLGVCGCLSCYVAMFPAILLGIVGIFGVSSSQTQNALNAYLGSALFQPILIISILFLIISLLHYGRIPLSLAIVAGLGIFVSMNFYMREWLFTLSFGILALAYYLAYRKSKSVQLKTALILISAVAILGVLDTARTTFYSPNPQNNNPPQQQTPASMLRMQ